MIDHYLIQRRIYNEIDWSIDHNETKERKSRFCPLDSINVQKFRFFFNSRNFSHICNSKEIISRIFDELDLNRDQRISKEEFKLYKNALIDGQKHFHRSTFEEKLGSIFALFDHNNDNYISSREIQETMKNLGEHIDDHLIEEMMRTADIDHDGRISREEFKKLLMQLYVKK